MRRPQRRAFERYRVRKYLLGTDGPKATARRRRPAARSSHVTLCSRHGKRPDRSAARVRGTAASPNDACAPERRRQLAADAAHSFRALYIVAQRLLADVDVQRQPTEAARASGRQASPATLAPLLLYGARRHRRHGRDRRNVAGFHKEKQASATLTSYTGPPRGSLPYGLLYRQAVSLHEQKLKRAREQRRKLPG